MKERFLLPFITALVLVSVATALWTYYLKNTGSPSPGPNAALVKTPSDVPFVGVDVNYYPGADGYYVRPDDGVAYPGVVMIHENRGLRPEIRMSADDLAQQGYQVLAVDLFGKDVETQTQAQALTAAYDQKKGIENMRAAVAFLRQKGAPKIASLGWCFGGGQSLQLAISGEKLDATVLYYGFLVTDMNALKPIKWPVLGLFAGADQFIKASDVKAFKNSLDALGVASNVYVYPGVGHAFANPSGASYAPTETKDAWAKTLAFLKKNLH